tara:strand:+ start:240 stop:506 length:267 start_codon:yes stop_codon:yes gene_type:complete
MNCQKIVNVIAVSSGVVSLAVVVGGVSLYVSRDAIVDGVKSQVMEAVVGSFGAPAGVGGGTLPTGANDLPSLSGEAPQASADVPADPF